MVDISALLDYVLAGLAFHILIMVPLYVISLKEVAPHPWLSFVPLANYHQMVKCADLYPVWTFFMFVPCLNFFALIYVWWNIAENRGHSGWLGLSFIIPIVGILVSYYIAFVD